MPVYVPDALPIVATEVVPLVHTPPETESDKVAESPTQTLVVPVITEGAAFTVRVTETAPQTLA